MREPFVEAVPSVQTVDDLHPPENDRLATEKYEDHAKCSWTLKVKDPNYPHWEQQPTLPMGELKFPQARGQASRRPQLHMMVGNAALD